MSLTLAYSLSPELTVTSTANITVMELPPNVMERGRGCSAGSVLLLKYSLLLHESRMMSE